jgi:hypothetical protein
MQKYLKNTISSALIVLVLFVIGEGSTGVQSTSGTIQFDVQDDGIIEATLNATGLGVGVVPSANLHVSGNAIVLDQMMVGGSEASSSNLYISGTFGVGVKTITGSGVLSGNEMMNMVNTGGSGNLTLDLPAPASHQGQVLSVKKQFSGNQVLIESLSRIDRNHSLSLSDGGAVEVISNGKYWYLMSKNDSASLISSQSNLLSYHNFESDYADQSGEGNSGSSGNTYSAMTVSGPVGASAIDFNELGDVIDAGNSMLLDGSQAFAISLWVKANSTTTGHESFSGWSSLPTPSGAGTNSPGEVAFTAVGNTFAFFSSQHSGSTETMEYGLTDRDFNGLTWTSTTKFGESGSSEAVSVAIDSDGKNLIVSAFAHNGVTEDHGITLYDLDFSNGPNWQDYESVAPNGAGVNESSLIDAVVVGDNIHLAAYLTNDNVESVYIGVVPKDLSIDPVWTDLKTISADANLIDGSGGGGEAATVSIDSDGQKLYYAFYSNEGQTEAFQLASSNLDGSNFSVLINGGVDNPSGAANNYVSHIAIAVSGAKLHLACAISSASGVEVLTAFCDLDGDNFSGWTSRGDTVPLDLGVKASVSVDMANTGSHVHLVSWSANVSSANLMHATLELSNASPIVSKGDVFSLDYSGGGFAFDWAGSPKSFGSIGDTSFHHVVVTVDGEAMSYYIDNTLVHRQSTTQTFSGSSDNLLIGGDGNRYFEGSLDDIRLFDRSLSAEEVEELYTLGQ